MNRGVLRRFFAAEWFVGLFEETSPESVLLLLLFGFCLLVFCSFVFFVFAVFGVVRVGHMTR